MTFTVIFEGDLSTVKRNPFKIESEFGTPIKVSVGDALEENDELRDILENSQFSRTSGMR